PLTETGRLRLARCVVEDGWPLRRAAERFQVSHVTAARWAGRYRELGAAGMADRSSRPHARWLTCRASDPHRPWRGRLAWYGRVLDEVLAAAGLDEVVLAGNSLGAAVALAAGSPRVAARALISPAGIVRLSVDPV